MTVNHCSDCDALQAKYEAVVGELESLAAESAAMLDAIKQTIGWQESVDICNAERTRLLAALETPVTDIIIAEIEARGVDKFADATIEIGNDEQEPSIIFAGKQAQLFAQQLRRESRND